MQHFLYKERICSVNARTFSFLSTAVNTLLLGRESFASWNENVSLLMRIFTKSVDECWDFFYRSLIFVFSIQLTAELWSWRIVFSVIVNNGSFCFHNSFGQLFNSQCHLRILNNFPIPSFKLIVRSCDRKQLSYFLLFDQLWMWNVYRLFLRVKIDTGKS